MDDTDPVAHYIAGYRVPILVKCIMSLVIGFIVASIAAVGYRIGVLDARCDPKFECLCSFACLSKSVVICTLILCFAFALACWLLGKESCQQINKYQVCTLIVIGALLGLVVFGSRLAIVFVVYDGYSSSWFSSTILFAISFIISLGAVQWIRLWSVGSGP